MHLSPLDEYPIHQTPALMVLTGIGYYPRLGGKDAYFVVRRGDTQTAVRMPASAASIIASAAPAGGTNSRLASNTVEGSSSRPS